MTSKMIDQKKEIDASFILISFFHRKTNDPEMCNKLANYPQMGGSANDAIMDFTNQGCPKEQYVFLIKMSA